MRYNRWTRCKVNRGLVRQAYCIASVYYTLLTMLAQSRPIATAMPRDSGLMHARKTPWPTRTNTKLPIAQTMASLVAAISSASTSGVSLAKAFFEPSGLLNHQHQEPPQSGRENTHLISVLTLTHSTSYSFFNASLICRLFALTFTINTSVLFSSIFFIALSVFNGCTMIFSASRRGACGIDLRGYFGARESVSVFGRWKVVDVRILRTLCELTCF